MSWGPDSDGSAEDRLRDIRTVTDSDLAHLNADALLSELLDRVRDVLDADTAAVLLLADNSRELVATAARGLEEEVHQNVRIPLGQGFAGRIAARKEPVILEDVDHSEVLNPVLRHKGIRSLLGVPLLVGGRVIGVLHVGTLTPRKFTDEDISLLQVVGDRVALAMRARRSSAERTAGVVLQRSLVPERLPDIPGLQLAGRYAPAEDGGVGGDWYDLFTVPSGHVFVIIGDVVGRGLRAAVVMGRLRSTVRAYALEVIDPAELTSRVDRKLQHFEPSEMATMLVAVLDPTLDRMRISLAGHPAPALATEGDACGFVDLPIDAPLGVRRGIDRHSTEIDIDPGSVLCFFTDGLVERRTVPIDDRLRLLCDSVTATLPDAVCRIVMNRLIGPEPPRDDVALLVLRRLAASELADLHIAVPAAPASLVSIRAALRRWLAATAALPQDIGDLLVAVGEASSNAVEHAYGPGQGTIEVHLELVGSDTVIATVRDTGGWRTPRGDNRGRGIPLIEQCSDSVQVDAGPTGTEIRIHRRIGPR